VRSAAAGNLGPNAIFYSKMENYMGYYCYTTEHPLMIKKWVAIDVDKTEAYKTYIALGAARLEAVGM